MSLSNTRQSVRGLAVGFVWLIVSSSIALTFAEENIHQELTEWLPWSAIALPATQRASAKVEALEDLVLAADVSGRIETLPVRIGDRVRAGKAIAMLERTPYEHARAEAQAQLAAAQTRLRQASRQFSQAERLRSQNLASEEALASARDAVHLAEREVERAQALLASAIWRLERTTVRAPFDGVIQERLATVGQWLSPGQGIVRLRSEQAEVLADVPRQWIEGLRAASEVFYQSLDGKRYPLRWQEAAPTQVKAGELVPVRLAFTATPAPVGSVGILHWQDPKPLLPPQALTTLRGELGVWTRDDPTSPPRFVPLPHAQAGRAVAVSLPEKALVAIRGQGALAWQASPKP